MTDVYQNAYDLQATSLAPRPKSRSNHKRSSGARVRGSQDETPAENHYLDDAEAVPMEDTRRPSTSTNDKPRVRRRTRRPRGTPKISASEDLESSPSNLIPHPPPSRDRLDHNPQWDHSEVQLEDGCLQLDADVAPNSRRRTKARLDEEDDRDANYTAQKPRSRKTRTPKENRKSKIFTSIGSSAWGLIQLTLAEDGIIWSVVTGRVEDRVLGDVDEHPHSKGAEIHTIPYRNILHIRRLAESNTSRNNTNNNNNEDEDDDDLIPYLNDSKSTQVRRRFGTSGSDRSTFSVDYVKESQQKLRPNVWEVTLDSEVDCCQWVKYVTNIIRKKFVRPKRVRVYFPLQKASSQARAVSLFCEKALPMAEKMEVHMDLVEGDAEVASIQLDMESNNVTANYDALAVVGDDRALSKVATALMNYSQKLAGHITRVNFMPAPARLPLALIPYGVHADVAMSVMGTNDFTTSTMHLLLGNKVPVNIATTFCKELLLSWNFSWYYGFPSLCEAALLKKDKTLNEMTLTSEYHVQLKKSKQPPAFECEIQYLLPNDKSLGEPLDERVCTRECTICSCAGGKPKSPKESTRSEAVEDFDSSDFSQNSDHMIELQRKDKWKVLKGSYVWIGVHSLTSRNSMLSPLGLSRYGHLHHGCMDLVLVKPCKTKDLVRFLRRHGENDKNPLTLPFVECVRVSAVRISPRLPISWVHKDLGKSEIDYLNSTTPPLSLLPPPSSRGIPRVDSGSWTSQQAPSRESSAGTSSHTARGSGVRSPGRPDEEWVIDDFGSDPDDDFNNSPASRDMSASSARNAPHLKPPLGSPALMVRKTGGGSKSGSKGRKSHLEKLRGSNKLMSSSLMTLPSLAGGASQDDASLAGDWFLHDNGDMSSEAESNPSARPRERLNSTLSTPSKRPSSSKKSTFMADSASVLNHDDSADTASISSKTSGKKRSGFFGSSKLMRRLSKSLKTTQATDADGEEVTYVRPSVASWELERQKRAEKERKKELKRRVKEEEKMKCPWLIDYEVYSDCAELRIDVYTDVLEIFGLGISPESKFPDNKLTWLPYV